MLGPNGGNDIRNTPEILQGILPRSVEFLFQVLRRRIDDEGIKFYVKMSYMQIYNEIIHDLLRNRPPLDEDGDGDGPTGLRIREYVDSTGSGDSARKQEIFVSGLSEFRAVCFEQIFYYYYVHEYLLFTH